MAASRQQTDRRIAAILRPEQGPAWEAWRAQRGAAATATMAQGRLHVLDAEGQPRAIAVRTGIGDGSVTEVQGEAISPGLAVIVGGGPRAAAPGASGTSGGGPRFGL
jgi:hypothetical protein